MRRNIQKILLAGAAWLGLSLTAGAVDVWTNLTPNVRLFDFNDYTNTAVWFHNTTGYSFLIATKNRALLTGDYHTNLVSGWAFEKCRMGTVYGLETGIQGVPTLTAPSTTSPYLASNLACNFMNMHDATGLTNACVLSPVFSDGAGTLYFDAINSLPALVGQLNVSVATAMADGSALTDGKDRTQYAWGDPVTNIVLNAQSASAFFRVVLPLNVYQPVKIKIERVDTATTGMYDKNYVCMDNLRLTPPPPTLAFTEWAVSLSGSATAIGMRVDNHSLADVSSNATRVITLHYRWNQAAATSDWATVSMACTNAGDRAGNEEYWNASFPTTASADLEYYLTCEGTYLYQSPDYTGLNYVYTPEPLQPAVYPADGTHLYKWVITEPVTVAFDAQGGTVTPASKIFIVGRAYGELPVPDPASANQAFLGWYTNTLWDAQMTATSTVSADVKTLYARWAAFSTVTLDAQGGSGGTASVTATNGLPMPPVTRPTRTGYDIMGFFDGTSASNQYYTTSLVSARDCDFETNLTLYAHWSPVVRAVTFNRNGGTGGSSQVMATYDEPMPAATAPSRDGYTFDGYWTSASGGTQYYAADMSSARNSDFANAATLYAHWTANTYSVILSPNGGSGGTTNVTATYGSAMPSGLTAPTRYGYRFNGYFDAASGGTQYYNASLASSRTWNKTSDSVLYAQWSQSTTIVTFDNQGGTNATKTVTALFGAAMPDATAPGRDGYIFMGYFDGTTSSNQYYSPSMVSLRNWDSTEAAATLYAHWSVSREATDLPYGWRFLDFNDYTNKDIVAGTANWTHDATSIYFIRKQLLAGIFHTNYYGWAAEYCRMGTGLGIVPASMSVPPEYYAPTVNPAISSNCLVNFQNYTNDEPRTVTPRLMSPVFKDGIGTLYFEAINQSPAMTGDNAGRLSVWCSTFMKDYATYPELVDGKAEDEYDWLLVTNITLDAQSSADFARIVIPFAKICGRDAVKIKIQRDDYYPVPKSTYQYDTYTIALDNIRASYPPSDVTIQADTVPFSQGYISVVSTNVTVNCLISNVGPERVEALAPKGWTTKDDRTVWLFYRWRYLQQKVNPWTAVQMVCNNSGDGLGNGEVYQTTVPHMDDVGYLEYYFKCNFNGSYYQSKDYTAAIPAPDVPGPYDSENCSPRILSASSDTTIEGTNSVFKTRIRMFDSDWGSIYAVARKSTDGTNAPTAYSMELVGANKWQARINIAVDEGVTGATNLTWYFKAVNKFSAAAHRVQSVTNWWGAKGSDRNAEMPTGGDCVQSTRTLESDDSGWMSVSCSPSGGNHVIITFDTEAMTYEAVRGEYQNFNGWTSLPGGYTDSNGYEPRNVYPPEGESIIWDPDTAENATEYFPNQNNVTNTYADLFAGVGQTPPVLTMAKWSAASAQLEMERNYVTGLPDAIAGLTLPNLALRLYGGQSTLGLGYLQNNANNNVPDGISDIKFKVRLASLSGSSSSDIAYYRNAFLATNYLYRISADFVSANSASSGKPSLSIVGYYQDMENFYEYRVTQIASYSNGSTIQRVQHELYRWRDGTPTLLVSSSDWNKTIYELLSNIYTGVMELRFLNSASGTTIYVRCGGTRDRLTYTDSNADRLTYGTCGFYSSDGWARFSRAWMKPITSITDSDNPSNIALSGGTLILSDSIDDFATTAANWSYLRYTARTDVSPTGLYSKIPSNRLAIYAQKTNYGTTDEPSPSGWNSENLLTTLTVSSFAYQNITIPVTNWQSRFIRFEVKGPESGRFYSDVIIDAIQLGAWHGQSNINVTVGSRADSYHWKYSEAWATTNTPYVASDSVGTNVYIHMDLSMANPAKAQALRSLLLTNGLGMAALYYRVTRAPAILSFQYAQDGAPDDYTEILAITNTTTVTDWTYAAAYLAEHNYNGYFRVVNVYDPASGCTNGVIDIEYMKVWDEPSRRQNSWLAYNAYITPTDLNRLWIDYEDLADKSLAQSCYLNNGSKDTFALYPQNLHNPYLMSPKLTNGIGTITFLARAWTNQTPFVYFQGTTKAWTDQTEILDSDWTNITAFITITNDIYRQYTLKLDDGMKYTAVRFMISTNTVGAYTPQRVCLDEIVITEPVYPSLDIVEVNLLRNTGSEGGVRTFEHFPQPTEGQDVDVEARLGNLLRNPTNLTVYLYYYVGTNIWGFSNWKNNPAAVKRVMAAVTGTNLLYRTQEAPVGNTDTTKGGIFAQDANDVVQYSIEVTYEDPAAEDSLTYTRDQTAASFTNPTWYQPLDLNKTYSALGWSPYYIVYDIPHGAVWINEVNMPLESVQGDVDSLRGYYNPYIEIAMPQWYSLDGWKIQYVPFNGQVTSDDLITLSSNNFLVAVSDQVEITNGYSLFLIGPASPYGNYALTNLSYKINNLDTLMPSYFGGALQLIRPSGMCEQSICLDGLPYFPYGYDMVARFPELYLSYIGYKNEGGSLSYTGRVDFTASPSRIDSTNTWVSGDCNTNWTPGALNVAYRGGPVQSMPDASNIIPGKSNVLVRSYLFMVNGESTLRATQQGRYQQAWSLKLPIGSTTNVAYAADAWYRLNQITNNGVPMLSAPAKSFTVNLPQMQSNIDLSVSVGLRSDLSTNSAYADNTLLAWLSQFDENEFAPTWRGTPGGTIYGQLDITQKYWLDLNPTRTNWFSFWFNGAPSNSIVTAWDPDIGRDRTTTNIFCFLKMATYDQDQNVHAVTNLLGDAIIELKARSKTAAGSDTWRVAGAYSIDAGSFSPTNTASVMLQSVDVGSESVWFRWYLGLRDSTVDPIPLEDATPDE